MLCYDVSKKLYSVGGETMKVHSWGLPVLYFVTTIFTSCEKQKKIFGYEITFHYTTYPLQKCYVIGTLHVQYYFTKL